MPIVKEHLTFKESRFVLEYCRDGNATRAAKAAGYSSKSAHAIGCENLKKPKIAAAIEQRRAVLEDRIGFSVEEYHRVLARQARGDLGDYGAWDNEHVVLYPSDEADTRIVREVKVKKSTTVRTSKGGAVTEVERYEAILKLYDAQQAAKILGEALGYNKAVAGADGPTAGDGEVVKVYSDHDWARLPKPPGDVESDALHDDDEDQETTADAD